jgi:hypothetical protein
MVDWKKRVCPIDPRQDQNTVYVATLYGESEYLLCSGGPVESWSYGTDQHLKEMKSEMAWIKGHSASDYDRIVKVGPDSVCNGDSCSTFYSRDTKTPFRNDAGDMNTSADWFATGVAIPDPHVDFKEQHLSDNLHLMQKLIDGHSGQIFYAKGVPNDPEKHFETKTPSYFNSLKEN